MNFRKCEKKNEMREIFVSFHYDSYKIKMYIFALFNIFFLDCCFDWSVFVRSITIHKSHTYRHQNDQQKIFYFFTLWTARESWSISQTFSSPFSTIFHCFVVVVLFEKSPKEWILYELWHITMQKRVAMRGGETRMDFTARFFFHSSSVFTCWANAE